MANVDEFIDARDGRSYKIFVAGETVWMAENLDFRLPGACAYGGDFSLRKQNGLLYTHEMAKEAIPKGWRLPRESDWRALFLANGGESCAGRLLLRGPLAFGASLSGFGDSSGKFFGWETKACFWSEETFGPFAHCCTLLKTSESPLLLLDDAKNFFSVRCVLD